MPHMLCRARLLPASVAVALVLSIAAPISVTFASTNPVSGDSALIADANGDTVRLRPKPGSSSPIVAEFPEGTAVDIIDGPTQDGTGSYWYRVAVEGEVSYIAADFLAAAGYETEAPEAVEPTAAPATEEQALLEISTANVVSRTATIANTNGDPIRCRATASTNGDIVALLSEGMTIKLTGDAQTGWQLVQCENQNG